MPRITENPDGFGCRITDLDLSGPLSPAAFRIVLEAFGRYGVLCFPDQDLSPERHKAFAGCFGSLEVNVAAGPYTAPGHPEVMILSNERQGGQPRGLADAGQDWHTDMSYSRDVAFLNVLHAIKVPRRDGRALGDTLFADMCAAYDALPPALARTIDGRSAVHDFDKFWERMRRRPGSTRGALTPEQRAQKPPVAHPMVLTHPLSGRRALYCNVGYTTHVVGIPRDESEDLLAVLFEHQAQERFQHAHRWNEGDVLAWDNLWTMHNAVPDYRPDETRLMHRCQVMADRVLDPEWVARQRVPQAS